MSDSTTAQQQPAQQEQQPAKQEQAPAAEPAKKEEPTTTTTTTAPAEEKKAEPAPAAKEEPKKEEPAAQAAEPAKKAEPEPAKAEEPKKDAEPAAAKPAAETAKEEPKKEEGASPKPKEETKKEETKKEETKKEETKKEEAKKDNHSTPKKETEHREKSTEQHSARRSSSVNAAQFPASPEELAKMSPIERVRLGYSHLRKIHQQQHPSAGFVSRTGRDPHRPFVCTSTTPQMNKRKEMEAARINNLASKIHYDPNNRPVQTAFQAVPANQRGARGSSWSRDTSNRRPLAPSYETIPSRLTQPTPGPGAYTSPLAFLGVS